MTSEPSFEYCSFVFMKQWEEDEKDLHRAFSDRPTLPKLRYALRYFQVARTFKGIADDANAEFVVDALVDAREGSLSRGREKTVHLLANRFKERFKKLNLSAASKLLWLSHRESYVIYDSRAVYALTKISRKGFSDRDYGSYAKAWREGYKQRELDIAAAVSHLPAARLFMRHGLPPDDKLLDMVNECWFKERVFDIFLWLVGAAVEE